MSAITIRKLPDHVHDALRRIAAERGVSVEALAREALARLAAGAGDTGDLFHDVAAARRRLGAETADWPEWSDAFDDPAFSRSVLGLDRADDDAGAR